MRLTERPLLGRPEDLAAENRELRRLREQVAAARTVLGELTTDAEMMRPRDMIEVAGPFVEAFNAGVNSGLCSSARRLREALEVTA